MTSYASKLFVALRECTKTPDTDATVKRAVHEFFTDTTGKRIVLWGGRSPLEHESEVTIAVQLIIDEVMMGSVPFEEAFVYAILRSSGRAQIRLPDFFPDDLKYYSTTPEWGKGSGWYIVWKEWEKLRGEADWWSDDTLLCQALRALRRGQGLEAQVCSVFVLRDVLTESAGRSFGSHCWSCRANFRASHFLACANFVLYNVVGLHTADGTSRLPVEISTVLTLTVRRKATRC